ncbi:bifunctional tetrahydrofolate synthase/dihydrofolate synthase [Vibrio rarus]|uniref:bifunctional tetrahydrofolate synthase/dihydrofolate synthase n=1 Tax=Vibrio rarus TaxID=413403 RepID=UPI0021C4BA8A|nr:bifunctional tetrahydrofolate synthase/dihydrofolate synthase [Vibrio rarus]
MSTHIPQATSSLSVWLDYLQSIHTSAIDLGLERISLVAEKSQPRLTKPAPKVITVAGTNGKGSTCAIMEAILLDAGYSVGVYSSPHLIRYNERVRINGQELADEHHVAAFHAIEVLRGDISLSFFEYATLAALHLFQVHNVDVVLLEVGLGGRLDATNIVDHDVSVITSLAIDHVDWLGDDINVIGFEKAGIFRSAKPAICGQPEAPMTVAAHADDIGATLYQVGYQYSYIDDGDLWHWQSGSFDVKNLPKPNLPLANAATALMALGVSDLNLTDMNIVNGLKRAQLAGRMQYLSQQPTIILDVAHNPHSAQYLVQQLQQRFPQQKIRAVVGMLHDKDVAATFNILSGCTEHWYPASLEGPRAASATELCQYLPKGTATYDNPVLAFEQALSEASADDIVVVMGSFFTVGAVLTHWQSRSNNGK